MVMVVTMHFLRESGSMLSADRLSDAPAEQFLGTFLEAFCIVAVNAYVFVSGYFGEKREFRIARILLFLMQIWFYSLLIPAVLMALGTPTLLTEMGVYGLIQYLLPIETESYWFATSFFGLMLLQPVLNAASEKLSGSQMKRILLFLLLLFCGIKSICPVHLATDRYGYDLIWFVCVYLTASYLRLYGPEKLKSFGWALYTGGCALIFGMTLGLWYALPVLPGAAYYFTVPFHYNFVLCLVGAVGLFYGFLGIGIKEGWKADIIRKQGSYSFGIYLLHEHPDLRHLWYPYLKDIVNPTAKGGVPMLLAELAFCVLALFAAGFLAEWIRDLLFGRLRAVYRFVRKRRRRRALAEQVRKGEVAENE